MKEEMKERKKGKIKEIFHIMKEKHKKKIRDQVNSRRRKVCGGGVK